MHQGKRLQSIAAFRINEGLTSWPLSPIYLLLWARYRSSTKRSPNFFGRAPGISEDKLDEGEDAACAPIEDEQSAVAILHSGYPSGHSDIADHAAQQRGDVQVSTSRHPPVDDSGAAGCGTIRILALSKGCISSAECLLMAHHGPAARSKPNVKLLHSDSRV
jgi:hypothetical protein